MSAPGNSINYSLYPLGQSHDPRIPVASTSTSTSTASGYAYAQQQQQLANRQAHPSQSHSSTASTSYTSFAPSSYTRQPVPQPKRPSPLSDRPHSIEELARIAGQDKYDRFGDIKQDLRYAEVYRSEGNKDLQAGDLEWAFIHFARTATLVLHRIPTNSHYNEMKHAHRANLTDNGNFSLERMDELKPKLVDRYEAWRQRNPNAKMELDMPRILSAMTVRDNEELAIRAQYSKMKRAASRDESSRRVWAEEESRQEGLVGRESHLARHEDGRSRVASTSTGPPQVYDTAARQAYEDARRRQEEARWREAEEARRQEEAAAAQKQAELERRTREAEEERRRREAEIARHKEAHNREQALRQEQEAASKRKMEELEYRRQRDDARRRELEETRQKELEGIAQRQRDADAAATAQASRSSLSVQVPRPVPMPIPALVPPPPSSPSGSSVSSAAATLTPRQQDGLPVLPLESPTREESHDPRDGRHHPQPQHAIPERATGRTCVPHMFHTLISC
ncbi:hypothetical protein JB92DRAFT_236559 [Gautieria morchelliformis]|nr:hypothetical protein JB92DRAFT_236559 [Gautieria morchelliformis]